MDYPWVATIPHFVLFISRTLHNNYANKNNLATNTQERHNYNIIINRKNSACIENFKHVCSAWTSLEHKDYILWEGGEEGTCRKAVLF